MEMFDILFNKASIYEMLFFNIKSVTKYPNFQEFKKNEPEFSKQWEFIAKTKYNTTSIDEIPEAMDDCYRNKAIYYPEFSKIVAISYATVEAKDNKLKRNLKRIVSHNEFEVISGFHSLLMKISSDGIRSTPQYFPKLCGHNVLTNDIPLFLKRIIMNRDLFETKENLIPYILKNYLKSKPWDANIIDTLNLWKFNGVSNTPLSIISDSMDLKRTTTIDEMGDLSVTYWNLKEKNEEESLEYVGLQSATQTNLSVQLFNEMRIL